ncbi:hypothetical protein Pcinc_009223 [Petrolisthes cinctipes]|uniref:CCHC-type domain-containing protein n=1 Tax=Petrolisthes cinctipes TaxID=88211 RepID=A0AAE1G4Z8_PETCI|nr:hypothetical protein Pcinc_009223 [Petrolisthes cinctipes]
MSLDTRGTKAVLLARLRVALGREETDISTDLAAIGDSREVNIENSVVLEDSASQIARSCTSRNSKQSSVVSRSSVVMKKAMETANKAGLMAKAAAVKERQRKEEEELKIRQEMEQLEIKAQIQEASAREQVFADLENEFEESVVHDTHSVTRVNIPQIQPQFDQVSHSPRVNNSSAAIQNEKLMDTLISYNLKSLMPKAEIQRFGGDMTRYNSFIRSFECVISKKLTNDEEKLYYLEQYTTGKPRDIVRACLHMPPGVGYEEARRLLEKRYGDRERIVAAYVDKILDWPHLKVDDIDGLDQFSVMLISCKNAMTAASLGAREIEHPKTMRAILEKLPFPMQDRWRRKADGIVEEKYRHVTFTDLVNFIEREARIVSNPFFGRHLFKSLKDSKPQKIEERFRSVNNKERFKEKVNYSAVEREKPQVKCFFCNGQHYLDDCDTLLQKSEKERKAFLAGMGMCYGCLRRGHMVKDCQRRRTCRICNKRHPTLLHRQIDVGNTPPPEAIDELASETVRSVNVNTKNSFLDKVGLRSITPIKLSVSTLRPEGIQMDSFMVTDVEVCDVDENNFITLPPVYVLDEIPVPSNDIVKKEDLQNWPHLSDIDIPDMGDAEIGLMIGNNVPQAMEPQEIIHSTEEGGPFALRTKIGWLVLGSPRTEERFHACVNRVKVESVCLDQMLTNLYNTEFKDLSLSSTKRGISVEDREWLKKVERKLGSTSNGHYEICLLFRDDSPSLPNNRILAMKRLKGLKRKFKGNPSFYRDYKKFMTEMTEKGHAEIVPEKGLGVESENGVWYIPHHGVYHPHKPDKIRVVFDCAARFKGISLNYSLLQGPDLTNPLLEVLIRFRQGYYAFTADIESMFYQVFVPERDRDYLRFLWWPEGNYEVQPNIYRMTVHLFGASSSPSCANYALQKTVEDHGKEYAPQVCQTVLNHFYVDDCLRSTDTEDEVIQLAHAVKSLCMKGGFNLTKFISNSRSLLESLPIPDRGKSLLELDLGTDDLPMEKVLGLSWGIEFDTIKVSVNESSRPLTKRGMLSTLSAIYDPLGMVAPYLLQGRIILQELCRLKLGWDEEIPDDHQNRWKQWKLSLPDLHKVSVKRCIKPLNFGASFACQLHHFADASEIGYGVVTYLRLSNDNGDVYCAFLYGRSRVAPLKSVTIPRLELTAATLAVRVNDVIVNALEIPVGRIHFWTDSTAVLRYIRNTKSRFHTFVANRLAIIHDGSRQDQWRHVPSCETQLMMPLEEFKVNVG